MLIQSLSQAYGETMVRLKSVVAIQPIVTMLSYPVGIPLLWKFHCLSF